MGGGVFAEALPGETRIGVIWYWDSDINGKRMGTKYLRAGVHHLKDTADLLPAPLPQLPRRAWAEVVLLYASRASRHPNPATARHLPR
jgi:hypothetical protein